MVTEKMGAKQSVTKAAVDVVNRNITDFIRKHTQTVSATQSQVNVINLNQSICTGSVVTIEGQKNTATMTVTALQQLKNDFESEATMNNEIDNTVKDVQGLLDTRVGDSIHVEASTAVLNETVRKMYEAALQGCIFDQRNMNIINFGAKVTEAGRRAEVKALSLADLRAKVIAKMKANQRALASTVAPAPAANSSTGGNLANPNLITLTEETTEADIEAAVNAMTRPQLEAEYIKFTAGDRECYIQDATLTITKQENIASMVAECTQDIVSKYLEETTIDNDVDQSATSTTASAEIGMIALFVVAAIGLVGVMMSSGGRRQQYSQQYYPQYPPQYSQY